MCLNNTVSGWLYHGLVTKIILAQIVNIGDAQCMVNAIFASHRAM